MAVKKILIAEDERDSAVLLEKILTKADYSVTIMSDGLKAYSALKSEKYDLLLTDWMMPLMDGIELIRRVRKLVKPPPLIIIITALSSPDARNYALNSGADDFIAKPYKINEILEKISNLFLQAGQKQEPAPLPLVPKDPDVESPFAGVCVAASSGGPQTLMELFRSIPAINNAAFFIVQHGPSWALQDMADRWNKIFNMELMLSADGKAIEPGKIYLAQGGFHTIIEPEKFILHLDDGPPENYIKPAADPLFRSAARAFGRKAIGVVMTGMGLDGSDGARHISAVKGSIIVQDPETAIVSSMPQAAINAVGDPKIAPLNKLGEAIAQCIIEKTSAA